MSTEAGAEAGADTGDGVPAEHRQPPDPRVIAIGVAVVLAVVAWAAIGTDGFADAADAALDRVLRNFAWLFVVAADVFLVLAVVVAFSRFGRIRLGRDTDEPEFTNLAWIAMMFSAGMGIGLMFFGVGEPLLHYASPPPFTGAAPQSDSAARVALEFSFFHWTLHPWAIYAVTGLGLAYATFRKGRGNQISSVFVPLLGSARAAGWPGRLVNLLAVFATVFGTATSLGLGALQVSIGLELTTPLQDSRTLELIIIAALGSAFVVSAFSGLHKGIKWLSSMNVVLAAGLMTFVFLLGPTVWILDAIPSGIGVYLQDLLVLSTRTGVFGDEAWMGDWTIFYWAWWISWAPFVGTFIARISHGRTVREFLIGVLLVPSGASVVWFSTMGGSALRIDAAGEADLTGEVTENGVEAAMFGLLDALPLGTLTSFVAMILVMTYFVTSADSASLVMGSLTTGGSLHPPRWLVVLWGVLMASVAAVLLVAGGLDALKTATILVALPFVVVMLGMCLALVRELRTDPGAGPPRHHPLHGVRDAMRAMIGEAVAEQRPRHQHPRLRRAAEAVRKGAGRGERGAGGDGPGPA
ncbi:BCCT family transporter [Streptomyces aidingensis]|uniref:Choline/carnitine/betaine transport n=1 Tax=Streptomyces aidingensis TaxID=910347 RepID=A0A1I1IWT7_9ACTN|nr:BCCT family transporter [Streptomyces aidingensis]SFC40162.1 choline/carnitine/betaine transport [Streptomyces aidingensis]